MAAALAAPLEYTRRTCFECHGSGQSVTLVPGCNQCRAYWTPARFDLWIEAHDRPRWFRRNRYKWSVALPCGHEFQQLAYRPLTCVVCRGVGTIGHWELARSYYDRITPPASRTSYHPAHFPAIAPLGTPLLADERIWDWQRGRYWQH